MLPRLSRLSKSVRMDIMQEKLEEPIVMKASRTQIVIKDLSPDKQAEEEDSSSPEVSSSTITTSTTGHDEHSTTKKKDSSRHVSWIDYPHHVSWTPPNAMAEAFLRKIFAQLFFKLDDADGNDDGGNFNWWAFISTTYNHMNIYEPSISQLKEAFHSMRESFMTEKQQWEPTEAENACLNTLFLPYIYIPHYEFLRNTNIWRKIYEDFQTTKGFTNASAISLATLKEKFNEWQSQQEGSSFLNPGRINITPLEPWQSMISDPDEDNIAHYRRRRQPLDCDQPQRGDKVFILNPLDNSEFGAGYIASIVFNSEVERTLWLIPQNIPYFGKYTVQWPHPWRIPRRPRGVSGACREDAIPEEYILKVREFGGSNALLRWKKLYAKNLEAAERIKPERRIFYGYDSTRPHEISRYEDLFKSEDECIDECDFRERQHASSHEISREVDEEDLPIRDHAGEYSGRAKVEKQNIKKRGLKGTNLSKIFGFKKEELKAEFLLAWDGFLNSSSPSSPDNDMWKVLIKKIWYGSIKFKNPDEVTIDILKQIFHEIRREVDDLKDL